MCSSTKCHAVTPLKVISLGLKFLVSPFFPWNLCQSSSGRDTALGVVMIRPNCDHLGSTVHHPWLWTHHRMRKKLQCIRGALNSLQPSGSQTTQGTPLGCFQKVSVHECLGPTPKVSDWIGLQSGWSFRNVKNPTPGDWNPCLTHPSQRQSSSPHAYSLIGFSKYPWQAVKINRVTFFLLGNLAVETLGYVADQHKAETRSQVLGLKVTLSHKVTLVPICEGWQWGRCLPSLNYRSTVYYRSRMSFAFYLKTDFCDSCFYFSSHLSSWTPIPLKLGMMQRK